MTRRPTRKHTQVTTSLRTDEKTDQKMTRPTRRRTSRSHDEPYNQRRDGPADDTTDETEVPACLGCARLPWLCLLALARPLLNHVVVPLTLLRMAAAACLHSLLTADWLGALLIASWLGSLLISHWFWADIECTAERGVRLPSFIAHTTSCGSIRRDSRHGRGF